MAVSVVSEKLDLLLGIQTIGPHSVDLGRILRYTRVTSDHPLKWKAQRTAFCSKQHRQTGVEKTDHFDVAFMF